MASRASRMSYAQAVSCECARVCACARACARVCACVRVCARTCACVRVCVCACVRVSARTCVMPWLVSCVCALACARAPACMRASGASVHGCPSARLPFVPASPQVCTYAQSPYLRCGFRRVWLGHNLNLKGWNSHVHRDFPGKFEWSNVSRDDVSRGIGGMLPTKTYARMSACMTSDYVSCKAMLFPSRCGAAGFSPARLLEQVNRSRALGWGPAIHVRAGGGSRHSAPQRAPPRGWRTTVEIYTMIWYGMIYTYIQIHN